MRGQRTHAVQYGALVAFSVDLQQLDAIDAEHFHLVGERVDSCGDGFGLEEVLQEAVFLHAVVGAGPIEDGADVRAAALLGPPSPMPSASRSPTARFEVERQVRAGYCSNVALPASAPRAIWKARTSPSRSAALRSSAENAAGMGS